MPKPTYDELVQLLVRLDYAGQLKRCYSESYILAFMDAEKELARALEKDAEPARPIRSRGWAESRYRMPKKGV